MVVGSSDAPSHTQLISVALFLFFQVAAGPPRGGLGRAHGKAPCALVLHQLAPPCSHGHWAELREQKHTRPSEIQPGTGTLLLLHFYWPKQEAIGVQNQGLEK